MADSGLNKHHFVVIMAGGHGTRLWPLSRPERPKQFLPLLEGRSPLQATWARSLRIAPPERILIVGSAAHEALYSKQLPDLRPENLILEPVGRNTAPCCVLAALDIFRRDAEAIVITLSADHVILNELEWLATMQAAAHHAEQAGRMVNIGIVPPFAESRYGYMITSHHLETVNNHDILAVNRFIEKPPQEVLTHLMATGNCLRNMGMFCWRADTLLMEARKHVPQVYAALVPVAKALGTARQQSLLVQAYATCPSISIDHGISQQTDRLSVVRSNVHRIDVGDFSAFVALWGQDEQGNAVQGTHTALDSRDNIIYAEGMEVATIGVEDMVIVADGQTVLVCPRDRTQDIKQLLKKRSS